MRKQLLTVLVAGMLVLAGCSGGVAPGEGGGPSDDGDATGTVNFYISDQQNAIGDFEHLNVTITKVGFHRAGEGDDSGENDSETETEEPTETPEATDATVTEATDTEMDDDEEREGWQEFEVEQRTVDLTELQGANATLLEQFNVTNGTYDKVFIHVSEVNGTLKNGESAEVKLPSSKIQLNERFTVGDGEEVDFVYDITVVKRGNSGKYNIKPVASESGTDVDIERVDEDDEGDGDENENRGQGRNGQDDEETETETEQSMGQMDFYVSDERNAIDDFRHLNVTITEVGLQRGDESGNWTTYDLNDTTVDLTELQGANATMLARLDVEAGTYTKVFVHVESVNGTLTDGTTTDVKLPSEKLQLNKEFEVGADESVDFVYDITVVKRGNSGSYNVKPVVGESGTDVPIADVDEDDAETDDRDGEASVDLNATFVGNVSAGENVTVRVTANGSAVENATVTYDGSEYTTNADGEVTVRVPDDAEEVEVAIAYADGEVELSDDLTDDGGEPSDGDRAEQETATGSTATPTPTPTATESG